MQHDSVKKTILVAFVLCIFCSVLVAISNVSLKDRQNLNKKLDVQKNLLLIAGLINEDATKKDIETAFKKIQSKIIDLKSGTTIEMVEQSNFNYKEAQRDSRYTEKIPTDADIAGIKIRSKISKIYAVMENNKVSSFILPLHGKGLWSTLWGFISLTPDTKTILGLGFYEHGETPGLGGEVDNPRWKSLWKGKKPFNNEFIPIIKVIKGSVSKKDKFKDSKVDGLSGASLTSAGVQNLVNFWLGEQGYGPFLKRVRSGESI